MTVMSALRHELARLLHAERDAAGLTPADLAARAGVPASTVTRIERGTLAASLDTVERLFAALGRRLRLDTEVRDDDADLDAQLDRLALVPLAERLARSGLDHLLDTLDGFPFVLDGALAANLHGVALPLDTVELAVAWSDADAFHRWLVKRFAYRWHERSEEFRALDLDPRAPGPHHWQTNFGRVRAIMCDELPDGVELTLGERTYRVRPLADVTAVDGAATRLLARHRERAAGAVVVSADPGEADRGEPVVPVAAVGN